MSPLADPALPFGLRDVKLRPIAADGTVGDAVDLPNARTFSFTETEDFEELRGDDKTVSVRGKGSGVDFDLEAGGISLAAYAVLAGGLSVESGVSPATVTTFTKKSTDARPYFQVEGQAISDSGGDWHVVLFKCRVTGDITGEMADGAFWLTGCSGRAIGDADDTVYEMISNETATDIAP